MPVTSDLRRLGEGMRLKSVVLCSLFVSILCAGLLSAQTGGAMLTTINGDVLVNGHAVGRSTSVFPGDRIEVPASAAASINLVGSAVVLSPNSSIQYDADNIQVLQGGTRVSTSRGITASVGQIVVTPRDSSVKFDVIHHGNRVVVVSREGALTVEDGARTIVVASGANTELQLPASAVQANSQDAEPIVPDYLSSARLSEHPFYGVVNGLSPNSPNTPTGQSPMPHREDGCGGCIPFPACSNVSECIRPNVSQLRRCCCPNSPPFCDARGNPH